MISKFSQGNASWLFLEHRHIPLKDQDETLLSALDIHYHLGAVDPQVTAGGLQILVVHILRAVTVPGNLYQRLPIPVDESLLRTFPL